MMFRRFDNSYTCSGSAAPSSASPVRRWPVRHAVHYVKAGHRFTFFCNNSAASACACIRQLIEFVNDPELDFDETDAVAVSRKLEKLRL